MDETPVGMSEEDSGKRKKNRACVPEWWNILTGYAEDEAGQFLMET